MAAQGTRAGHGSTGSITDQLVPGAIAGVGAWIVGLILTSVIAVALGGADAISSGAGGGGGGGGGLDIAIWKAAGILFHGAHFVGIEVPIVGSVNIITEVGGEWLILLLVPPLVLLGAGYYVASNAGVRDSTDGAKAGAMIVAGYLPLALVGAFLFTVNISNQFMSISLGPSLAMSAILMGIAYPAIFGGIGGYLGSS